MKNKILIALILILGEMTLIIGCKSETERGANQNTPIKIASTVKTDTVIIENMAFNPAVIKINPGDSVVWINKGIVAHNVTEDTAHTWTSGDIPVDSAWKMLPVADFNYLCTIHPTMKGSVKIVR
jgi:plastocyanin